MYYTSPPKKVIFSDECITFIQFFLPVASDYEFDTVAVIIWVESPDFQLTANHEAQLRKISHGENAASNARDLFGTMLTSIFLYLRQLNGCGGGIVVSVLAFYSDDQNSNPPGY